MAGDSAVPSPSNNDMDSGKPLITKAGEVTAPSNKSNFLVILPLLMIVEKGRQQGMS